MKTTLRPGSVSERISQQSPVPTPVVRFPDRLIAWARQERHLNIVVGADFSASSEAALTYLREWRGNGPCAVQAIHLDVESGAAAGTQITRDLRRRLRGVLDEQVEVRVDSNPAGAAAGQP